MNAQTFSPGNLLGSFGVHNTIAAGPAAPSAPPLPASLAAPAVPLPPATLPTPDATSLANIQANQRAVAQAASAGGRASTILTSFAARPPSGGGGASGGTGDYSKTTLAAG